MHIEKRKMLAAQRATADPKTRYFRPKNAKKYAEKRLRINNFSYLAPHMCLFFAGACCRSAMFVGCKILEISDLRFIRGGGICALSPKTVLEGLPMVGVALCRVVKINKNQNIMKSLQFIETKGVAYCAPTMKVLRVFAEEGFSVSLPDLDVEDGAEWDEVER